MIITEWMVEQFSRVWEALIARPWILRLIWVLIVLQLLAMVVYRAAFK